MNLVLVSGSWSVGRSVDVHLLPQVPLLRKRIVSRLDQRCKICILQTHSEPFGTVFD